MNVSLSPKLESLIQEKVTSGLYASASEVVREALRLLEERDRLREIREEELRAEIRKGVADEKAGRVAPLDMEAVKREARARRDNRG